MYIDENIKQQKIIKNSVIKGRRHTTKPVAYKPPDHVYPHPNPSVLNTNNNSALSQFDLGSLQITEQQLS